MCRLVGWIADRPVTTAEALGEDVLARLLELGKVHRHGWGAAWHNDPGSPIQTRRSEVNATTDPEFMDFARRVEAQCCLLHLRHATPGMGMSIENSHPFIHGGFAFAHNGAIYPHDKLDALLYPGSDAPRGTTDSERYFLSLVHDLPGDPLSGQVAAAASRVTNRMVQRGLSALSLNAMLLTGGVLHVLSNHAPGVEPEGFQLWPDTDQVPHPPYFQLAYRDRDGVGLAVSTGLLSMDEPDVSEVAAGNILTLRPGRRPLEYSAIERPLLSMVNVED
ncbi:MAG: class II glutamine amidotransferase [Nocardioidaceae bacterium]